MIGCGLLDRRFCIFWRQETTIFKELVVNNFSGPTWESSCEMTIEIMSFQTITLLFLTQHQGQKIR